MASSTLERYLAVGSGFGGRRMPLEDAGDRTARVRERDQAVAHVGAALNLPDLQDLA
ncbi:MAG: hypothetical protein GY926_07440 [bacterium]|nr:hypothetical protein [bacterium]